MSIKYEVDCPYCGVEQCLRTDDDESDRNLELSSERHTCTSCSLVFKYVPMRTVYYTTRRADCLNGAAHNWTKSHQVVSNKVTKLVCFVCGTITDSAQEENTENE